MTIVEYILCDFDALGGQFLQNVGAGCALSSLQQFQVIIEDFRQLRRGVKVKLFADWSENSFFQYLYFFSQFIGLFF